MPAARKWTHLQRSDASRSGRLNGNGDTPTVHSRTRVCGTKRGRTWPQGRSISGETAFGKRVWITNHMYGNYADGGSSRGTRAGISSAQIPHPRRAKNPQSRPPSRSGGREPSPTARLCYHHTRPVAIRNGPPGPTPVNDCRIAKDERCLEGTDVCAWRSLARSSNVRMTKP